MFLHFDWICFVYFCFVSDNLWTHRSVSRIWISGLLRSLFVFRDSFSAFAHACIWLIQFSGIPICVVCELSIGGVRLGFWICARVLGLVLFFYLKPFDSDLASSRVMVLLSMICSMFFFLVMNADDMWLDLVTWLICLFCY